MRRAALLGCFALLGCSPLALEMRPPIDIADYRGDGLIARIPNALNPGFSIDFETFTLDTTLVRTYTLEGLPKPRHKSDYQIALVVDTTQGLPEGLGSPGIGTLSFRVLSRNGTVLAHGSAEVSELHWQRFENDMPCGTPASTTAHGHASSDSWTFPSTGGEAATPATLEVRYTPGAGGVIRTARVRLMAGGID